MRFLMYKYGILIQDFFDVQVWDTYTRFLMFEFATQLDRFSYALLNPAKTFSMN